MNLVGIFQAHPDWTLRLVVNSAPVGQPGYSLGLTQQRAVALKEALLGLGVKASWVEATGVGEANPVASNETEKGRQLNTRVHILKR